MLADLAALDAPALRSATSEYATDADEHAARMLAAELGGPAAGVWPRLARWRMLDGDYARYADLRHLVEQTYAHRVALFEVLALPWTRFDAAAGQLNTALRRSAQDPDAAVAAGVALAAVMAEVCAEHAAAMAELRDAIATNPDDYDPDDVAQVDLDATVADLVALAATWQQRHNELAALPAGHTGRCLSDDALFLPIEDQATMSAVYLLS